jgi:hypothetical protein
MTLPRSEMVAVCEALADEPDVTYAMLTYSREEQTMFRPGLIVVKLADDLSDDRAHERSRDVKAIVQNALGRLANHVPVMVGRPDALGDYTRQGHGVLYDGRTRWWHSR